MYSKKIVWLTFFLVLDANGMNNDIEKIMNDLKTEKTKIEAVMHLLKNQVVKFSDLKDSDGNTIIHIAALQAKINYLCLVSKYVEIDDINLKNKKEETASEMLGKIMIQLLAQNKKTKYTKYSEFCAALSKLTNLKQQKKNNLLQYSNDNH